MPTDDDHPSRGGRPVDPGSLRSKLERGEARQLKVIVSEDMHRALRVQAALSDRSLSELVSEAIAAWLEQQGDRGEPGGY